MRNTRPAACAAIALVACSRSPPTATPPPVPTVASAAAPAESIAPSATAVPSAPSTPKTGRFVTRAGRDVFGPIPDGAFADLAGGNDVMCALDAAGRATCWGTSDLIPKVPQEPLDRLSFGSVRVCARLRASGLTTCWGFETTSPPPVKLEVISAGTAQCGLDASREAVCWGEAKEHAPRGPLLAISSGEATSCAVTPDGHVRCWLTWGYIADHTETRGPPRDGNYATVVVGYEHACALTNDGAARCWGRDTAGEIEAPAGKFKQLTLGEKRSCALTLDGSVSCWGGHPAPAPAGVRFERIAITTDEDLASPTYLCGIVVASHAVTCWGYE